MEKRIETKADEMLMRIRREKRMNIPELQKALGLPKETIEEWISIFESRGLLDMVYPANPVEPPYVVINDEPKRRATE